MSFLCTLVPFVVDEKIAGPSGVFELSVFAADQGFRMPVQIIGEHTNGDCGSGQFLNQSVDRDGIHGR